MLRIFHKNIKKKKKIHNRHLLNFKENKNVSL